MDEWIDELKLPPPFPINPLIQKSIHPLTPFRVTPTFFARTRAVMKKHEQQLRHSMEV
jgi:hypothetical protein